MKRTMFLAMMLAAVALSGADLVKNDTIEVDGNLSDWEGVRGILAGSWRHSSTPLEWHGPGDASYVMRLAWNEEGLLIGATIYDNDIDQKNDLLELSCSARPNAAPFARDTLRIGIVPPGSKKEAGLKILNLPRSVSGVERVLLSSSVFKGGYRIEMFLPLELIPEYVSPSKSKISIKLKQVDSDQKRIYPQTVTRGAFGKDNGTMIPFSLVEKASKLDAEGLFLGLEIMTADPAMTVHSALIIRLSNGILKKDSKCEFSIGELKKTLTKTDFKKRDDDTWEYSGELDFTTFADGEYPMVFSVDGIPYTQEKFSVLATASQKGVSDTVHRLEQVNLPVLSGKDPWRAMSYAGVISALEWLKWGIEQKAPYAIREAHQEIKTRLAVLEGQPVPAPGSVYRLLELTRNPEAQAVIEYFRERVELRPFKGSAAIYFGSIPLVSAMFDEHRSPEAAAAAFKKINRPFYAKQIPIDGVSVLDVPQALREPAPAYDPETHLLVQTSSNTADVIPFAEAKQRGIESIYIFPGTEAGLAKKIEAEAAKYALKSHNGVRMGDVISRVAFAGNPDDSGYGKKVVKLKKESLQVSPVTGILYFVCGKTLFTLPYVSHDAAKQFASILIAGKPVSVVQRDQIRQSILKAIGRTPRKLAMPSGLEAFCGDNHTHTFLSDGRPTPLTVTSQATYVGLDYHILADHGVYRGARKYVESTLRKFGYLYPAGVGIELNSKWGHMNVYPLTEEGGYSFGPTFEEMVATAHKNNAIIQWNHPDTDYSNLPDYLENGLKGSNLDAWEHYPPHYSKWKREGRLPVLVGGTDTHNGTFHMPERSLMFLPSCDIRAIADGLKAGRIVMVDPWNGAYTVTRGMINKSRWDSDFFFYGADDMIQLAVDVLADNKYLLSLKEKRVAEYFRSIDVKGLIASSSAYCTPK